MCNPSDFPNNLQVLRLRAGLSRKRLDELCRFAKHTTCSFEGEEKDAKLEHICKLVNVLKCTPNELIGITPIN